MPAKRKGSSATTRNERRGLRKSFQKKVESQGLKIVKLEQTVTQLRKSQRLKSVSTCRFLPDFPFDGVQHLSVGSVRPLLNHPARGMTSFIVLVRINQLCINIMYLSLCC